MDRHSGPPLSPAPGSEEVVAKKERVTLKGETCSALGTGTLGTCATKMDMVWSRLARLVLGQKKRRKVSSGGFDLNMILL